MAEAFFFLFLLIISCQQRASVGHDWDDLVYFTWKVFFFGSSQCQQHRSNHDYHKTERETHNLSSSVPQANTPENYLQLYCQFSEPFAFVCSRNNTKKQQQQYNDRNQMIQNNSVYSYYSLASGQAFSHWKGKNNHSFISNSLLHQFGLSP